MSPNLLTDRNRPQRTSARMGAAVSSCLGLGLLLTAAAWAQTSTTSPRAGTRGNLGLTLLTAGGGTTVTVSGHSRVSGPTPLDLPKSWTGRYSVSVEGPGYAKAHGVIYVPPEAVPPYSLSSGSGLSPSLVLHTVNYPGIPAMSVGSGLRGAVFAVGATAGAGLALRAHLFHEKTLDDEDPGADDRAREYKQDRNRWLGYAGAMWGMSALDYWIRPRVDVIESSPQRVVLSSSALTRGGVAWRALLVPGAGHEFANRRTRGAFWLASVLAAGAGALVADHSVRHNQNLQTQVERELATVTDPTEFAALLEEIDRRAEDVRSAKDYRRVMVTAAAGLYAASFVDAMIMPLATRTARPAKVSAVTRLGRQRSELAINLRF